MKTTKSSIANALKATRLSFYAVTLLALTAAPFGCADENKESRSDVSMKTGALSEPSPGKASFRKHRRTGDDGRSRGDGLGRHKRGPRGHRRGDSARVLFKAALDQDSLTSDQRQKIESLMAETKQGRGMRRDPPRGFRMLMEKALRDGQIDADAIKSHFESMTQHREARAAARSERLNALHATLDAEQRQAVVADVKTRWEEKGDRFKGRHPRDGEGKKRFGKGGRHGRRGDKGGFAAGDNPDRAGHGKGSRGRRGGPGGRGDGIFGLVREMDLTEEQRSQIDALKAEPPKRAGRMADNEEMEQCRTRLLDGFAGGSFDAAAVRCQKRADEGRTVEMNQRLENLSTLINILTEEQRRRLADHMEGPNLAPLPNDTI